MSGYTLAACIHISSVFPSSSHVTTHVVPTERRDLPLATALADILDDHASHSSIFSSPESDDVLIRLVHGNLAVELVSLSLNTPPVRFVFPALVAPNPALVTFSGNLFLVVVTASGSLFKIHVPTLRDGQFWHKPLSKNWCREWQIKKLGGQEPRLAHVHSPHDVSIALNSEGFLRLESHTSGLFDYDVPEMWTETEWKSSSWYTSLFPTMASGQQRPGQILSMASAQFPTDVPDIFTLSRDLVLRRWGGTKGCRAEISLRSSDSDEEVLLQLLDSRPQKLLQVRPLLDEDGRYKTEFNLIVFMPTPSSSVSGGSFYIYNVDERQWKRVVSLDASPSSVHCRLQDFTLANDTLYVLWEKQGQTMLEAVGLDLTSLSGTTSHQLSEVEWQTIQPDSSNELTQEAMDELLLQHGSLTDKFLQSIMRPGLFSVVTVRSALQSYKEHYLSLPGPHPTPLVSTYATLSQNIAATVGCTVTLSRDPQTGMLMQKQYWQALRRDWEGFLARCKEIERSARWPLCLGVTTASQILVVERERISQCTEEDKPLQLCRSLYSSKSMDPPLSLLAVCWELRKKLSPQLMQNIEAETVTILMEDIAFPLVDIVAEASGRVFSRDAEAEAELTPWLSDQLRHIGGFDDGVREIIDILEGSEDSVKMEEDEVELILPPDSLDWKRALVTSYITETVEARYDLCLAFATVIFCTTSEFRHYDPGLIIAAFAPIRGVAMFRYLCRQPAGDLEGSRPLPLEGTNADDVASRLSNMHMSRGGKKFLPAYSLVHRLLAEYTCPSSIEIAAHQFMRQVGFLHREDITQVSKDEVLLCEELRKLGYRETCSYLLSCLPRTPAVCYVTGRLWIDSQRDDEAIQLLHSVAGSFGPDSVLTLNDTEALTAALPAAASFTSSECDYYLHVAELLRNANFVLHEVHFTKLALSVWPPDDDSSETSLVAWDAVIRGYTNLGLYEDAYSALISSPHHDKSQQHVTHLVYKMCEDDALDRLLSMNFRGLVEEVEVSLSFKARNADPRVNPNWSHILYTWYTWRGDYSKAALTMYIRFRKLSDLQADSLAILTSMEQQIDALAIAINALSLVEGKNPSVVVPAQGSTLPPRKRQRVGGHIPEERFSSGRRNVDIVDLATMKQEYAHLLANAEVIRRDPSNRSADLASPWVTISKLTQAGQFELAMSTAKILSVDMSELFQRLALQCVRLSSADDTNPLEIAKLDWLLTDKVSSWPGTPKDRGWRYLRQCLERYDSVETDYSYNKAVLETLLSHDASLPPPPWLLKNIRDHHPDYLIRICLRYGNVDEALESALLMVQNSTSSWGDSSSPQAGSTWLPYTVLDAVLKATEEDISERAQNLRKRLQVGIENRLTRLQKHTEMPRRMAVEV